MHVTVKYHGIIGDMLQRKTEQITLAEGATVDDLFTRLTREDEQTAAILKQTRAFIDGKQADRAAPLSDGAEVIFMRPIAGGSSSLPT
ncbi:MAG: MoaD/ThiS family protein [Thermomicrobiales bacterium]